MNKKTIIGIIIAIVIIGVIAGGIVFTLNKAKAKPEDIWQQYISYINERKYEEMYGMLTEESKAQISQEDFITRNKNIYEGIDMTNMQVEVTGVEEEDSKTSKISYKLKMDTEAGSIDFTNIVRLTKDKENGYVFININTFY